MRQHDPTFPFHSALWRAKCESDRAADLVKCGFVCCLMNDYTSALGLFKKASQFGSETASLMCGVIYYYGLVEMRDWTRGLGYFSRCQLQPVALMHIALAQQVQDKEWRRRAKQLLSPNAPCKNISEKIGDLFYEGIKLPKVLPAAIAWYLVAFTQAEAKEADTTVILGKVSQVILEQRTQA
jgi:TPR repeat protein